MLASSLIPMNVFLKYEKSKLFSHVENKEEHIIILRIRIRNPHLTIIVQVG